MLSFLKQVSDQFSLNSLIEISGKTICLSICVPGMCAADTHILCGVHKTQSSFAISLHSNFIPPLPFT